MNINDLETQKFQNGRIMAKALPTTGPKVGNLNDMAKESFYNDEPKQSITLI